MRNLVNTYVDQFRQDRQKQIKLAAVLAALAVIVAGVVFWQLHSTGVAMTNEVFCGMEEHVHDDSCYEQVLVCGLDESGPAEGHVHSDACYETVETLVCQDESEGHVHTEACYVTEQNLVCGLEESEGTEGHVHSDACYEMVLTCEIPEHTHTIECMNDEEADVETAEDWEATLPEELSGVWSQDVMSIAESQIGYTESERNFRLADDGETRQGYTRYGAWYGNAYGDWDAMFASFCLNYAGVPEDEFPESSGVYAWVTELGNSGLYVPADKFTPQAGDLAFFDADEDGEADSVGIVSYLSSKDIYVIEGNREDAVTEQTYDLDDNQIIGYGILPDQPGVEAEPVTLVQQTLEATIYSDASCVKTLSAAESITLSGMMPENASVIAYPVDVTIGDMTILAAYDITIYDENGHEFEPEDGTVQVSISNSAIRSALGNNEEPVVYHINDRTDVLEKVSGCSTTGDMIEFTAESFSIYIVGDNDVYQDVETGEKYTVYTVEFYRYEYDADAPSAKMTSTQYVLLKDTVNQPGAEEYEYHTFLGWYTEMQGTDGELKGYKLDFASTLEKNFDEWGWNENDHTVKLYTAYEAMYYVYYMLDENMWADDPSVEANWADFYTEEYRPGQALDTSSADSMVRVELGDTYAVTGWYVPDKDTGELTWDEKCKVEDGAVFGTDITEDLKLYPKIEEVVWIYFTLGEEEGENVKAADPTYVLASEETLDGNMLPTEKTDENEDGVSRPGYTLLGWNAVLTSDADGNPLTWYEDGNGEKILITRENASEIKIEDVLNKTYGWIDLYAVWEPNNVSYTVNIWRQKATDGKLGLEQKEVQAGETYEEYIKYYDYAESITVSSDESTLVTGTSPDKSILDDYNKKGEKIYQNTDDYNGFEYNEERSVNDLANKVMAADGSTIINVFYDRVTVTWNLHKTNRRTSMSNSNLWNTLIGLYNTNITPTNGSEPGGMLSEWTQYSTTSSSGGYTYYDWANRIGETDYITIFETEFVFKDDDEPETTDFWYTDTSSGWYIYYYLEVTNYGTQVNEDGDKAKEASENNVEYLYTITDDSGETTQYVYDRIISIGSNTDYTVNNKYIGYNVAHECSVTSSSVPAEYGDIVDIDQGYRIESGTGNHAIFCDAITYTIDLYSNHDGEQLIESFPYKYGADLSEFEFPAELDADEYGPADYYHFAGTWWEDPTFTAEFQLPDIMPGNNMAAYADWELNDITVTFNSYVESDLFNSLAVIYGEENITVNSNGNDGLWSYSITLKATDMLDYRLDNRLVAVKENEDDPDIYEFISWWNTETDRMFSFETILYDDITLEARWHEADTFYQIVYVINWDDYDVDEGYRLGSLHTREGEAEVRQVDYSFDGNPFDDDHYPKDKFICWEDNAGNRYYPGEYVDWQNVPENLLTQTDGNGNPVEDGHYYYVLRAVWAEENESVLHLYPNCSGTSNNDYSNVSITVESLGTIDLSLNYEDDGTVYAIPHAGDTYTDSDGVTYHFAGWSTTDPEGPGSLSDVDVPCDVTVGVDTLYDNDGNEISNNLYGVWLADKSFTIVKEDTNGNELTNAEFTLTYTYSTTTGTATEEVTYYYDPDEGWVEQSDNEQLPTFTIGQIEFEDDHTDGIGLFDYGGIFTLTEENAPEGYRKLANEITFTLNGSDSSVEITKNVTSNNNSTRNLASASGTTLTVQNEAYTFPVYIIKYSGTYVSQPPAVVLDDDDTPSYISLQGAEFILSRTVTSGDGTEQVYAIFYYENNNGSNEYELTGWTEDISKATTLTSDEYGFIKIDNLETGSYTLTETKAPDGYMLLDEGIVFTVNSDGSVTVISGYAEIDAYEHNRIAVGNVVGSELPYTGGVGTWIYTIAGVLLIGGAAALLVYRKRRAV